MSKKMLLLLGALSLSFSCTNMNHKPDRSVADDRRNRSFGYEMGDYDVEVIRNNSGLINVAQTFSDYRNRQGRNLKGILIEARSNSAYDQRPGRPGRPGNRFDPRITILLQSAPIQSFTLDGGRREFFYADLDREIDVNMRQLFIQYDPNLVTVTQITILTNDDRPWENQPGPFPPGPAPLPPGPVPGPGPFPPPMPPRVEFGVIYRNSTTYKSYFAKASNQMEADFRAKELCQRDSYSSSCAPFKSEELTPGQMNYSCMLGNSTTYLSYKGSAPSRLEAEIMARNSCEAGSYISSCGVNLKCTDGRYPNQPGMLTSCMYRNTTTYKTYFAKAENELDAQYAAAKDCQSGSYISSCQLNKCEAAVEGWQEHVCYLSNTTTRKSFRGAAKNRLEAEALARQSCESDSYISSCGTPNCTVN